MYEKAPLSVDNDVDNVTPARPRRSFSRGAILIVSFLLLALGTLLNRTTRCYHPIVRAYSHLRPESIEQRVHKILSETPLIGRLNSTPELLKVM